MDEETPDMIAHNARVSTISTTVRQFYTSNTPFRIFHGSSNSTRAANRQQIVDISSLNNVLSIDKVKKTVTVEPGIAMDALVRQLIPLNLMPAVVPEFPGITAGGAFAGTAAESSSFRHGYFDKTVLEMEMVLGNGEIVRASPTANADLFFGSAGAMGTLGITTLLEIQLVDCAPYVELTYNHITSQDAALKRFNNVPDDVDFIDGIMYSNGHSVVIEGRFAAKNEKSLPIVRFTRPSDPWFFAHVHRKFRCMPFHEQSWRDGFFCITCMWTKFSYEYAQDPGNAAMVEMIPLEDYLFRYDRGVYWMACHGWAPYFWNRFTRWLLNSVWHTRFMYRVLHLVGGAPHIIQDLAIPERNASGFLDYIHEKLKIYPLWLCPIKHDARTLMHNASTNTQHTDYLVSIGVWGAPIYGSHYLTADTYDRFAAYNKDIENRVTAAGGLKWLYATNWYSEEEFWALYDQPAYARLRTRWGADRLPDVWAKVCRSQQDITGVTRIQIRKAMVSAALGLDRLVM